ncbi:radical SAM protein, partial [Patescibacteria group bacterium]|nr:radical SAM protein [Patescibacteria group bacterium]
MDRKNKEFIKSRWVYIYKHGGELAIFNSKNLEIFFVDQETINLLNYFKEPHNIDEAFIFFKDKSQKIKKIVNNLMKTEFIVPIDLNETKKLEKEVVLERKKKESLLGDSLRLNSLRIVLTEICNLDCSYCFVHNRDLRKEDDISFSTIKKSIDLLVSLNKGGDIEVQFFGGEPLLKWDLIVETVDYVEKIINQGKIKNVYYGITTNGILINQKKSKFFKDNNFLVSVSLDGWESLNDLNRHYSNKKGSFDKIINGLEVLKNNDNEIGILVTPDKNNIK